MAVDEKTRQLEKLRQLLDPKRLHLPPGLPVDAITVEDHVDYFGEEALEVWAVLPEDLDVDKNVTGRDVLDFKRVIWDTVLNEGIELFPYIHFAKPSELKQLEEDRRA